MEVINGRQSIQSTMLVGKVMVVSCCIVGCTNRALKGTSIHFYCIPKPIRNQGKDVEVLTQKRYEC